MDRANLQKWPKRPDQSYRDSVFSEVGYQDWYYNPGEITDDEYGRDEDRPELLDTAFQEDDDIDGRAISTLPIGQLDALAPHERKCAARRRDSDWPSTDAARDRLQDTIQEVIRNEDDHVIDGPTPIGKSYNISSTRWGARDDITGGRPVVHLLETRDTRDVAVEVADGEGSQLHVLRGRHEACPVCAGSHDPRQVRECDDEDRQAVTVDDEPAS